MPKGEGNVVAQNKKARHDYSIVDTIEAGFVLTGTEIKSVRAARIQLKDGYAQIKNGEAWLSMFILLLLSKVIFGIKIQTVRENYCLRRSKSPNFKMTLREQE